ncbi:MAG TPA: FtsX-like permease family protein [Kofleriaceae bacterium]|nr:FtsX-like permease family protein [Kofleriaceae bacterium]
MKTAQLARMVVANTVRSRRHFALSAFGIVIGIGAFVFFLGLSQGVSNVLLGEVFPLDRVDVIAPQASLLGQDLTRKLTDESVAEIRSHPDVKEAVPRMGVSFPAAGTGYIKRSDDKDDYHELRFEVGGFCDGISGDFVAGEDNAAQFKYWEDEPNKKPCSPEATCADELYYCDKRDNLCHHRVPAYVSKYLIEIYNAQFASTHGLPKIDQLIEWMAKRGGLQKMRFYINLGASMMGGSKREAKEEDQRMVEAMILGTSDKAMPIGITVPIEYVRDWNKEYASEEAASTYTSIGVVLKNKDDVAPFASWLQEKPRNLRLEDRLGEQFATAIAIVTWILLLISIVIVTISSINIGHSFFMQVTERRREIGVLRAVGATRRDIQHIFLGEAALIGILGGVLGIVLATVMSLLVDFAASRARDFPFKPDTYFDFQWWILAGGLGFSMLFCILGGYLPARRAARMAPAQALAQQ